MARTLKRCMSIWWMVVCEALSTSQAPRPIETGWICVKGPNQNIYLSIGYCNVHTQIHTYTHTHTHNCTRVQNNFNGVQLFSHQKHNWFSVGRTLILVKQWLNVYFRTWFTHAMAFFCCCSLSLSLILTHFRIVALQFNCVFDVAAGKFRFCCWRREHRLKMHTQMQLSNTRFELKQIYY